MRAGHAIRSSGSILYIYVYTHLITIYILLTYTHTVFEYATELHDLKRDTITIMINQMSENT